MTIKRIALAYWSWNGRAFQSVKVNLGYWVAATCVAYLVISVIADR